MGATGGMAGSEPCWSQAITGAGSAACALPRQATRPAIRLAIKLALARKRRENMGNEGRVVIGRMSFKVLGMRRGRSLGPC
ncbi:hypothetical protein GCM10009107_51720 [Ideonella azotifigens]|uniref:ESPR domain-containing protein n=1 Tax=Ideonella azotifigens TaxID=513160 RepID=A0ABN1KF98_9BURK